MHQTCQTHQFKVIHHSIIPQVNKTLITNVCLQQLLDGRTDRQTELRWVRYATAVAAVARNKKILQSYPKSRC